jgi:hypothetical protein
MTENSNKSDVLQRKVLLNPNSLGILPMEKGLKGVGYITNVTDLMDYPAIELRILTKHAETGALQLAPLPVLVLKTEAFSKAVDLLNQKGEPVAIAFHCRGKKQTSKNRTYQDIEVTIVEGLPDISEIEGNGLTVDQLLDYYDFNESIAQISNFETDIDVLEGDDNRTYLDHLGLGE